MTDFVLILLCSIFYIMSKSFALFLSAQTADIKLNYKESFAIFTRSALIEITLFPAKIAGDTYKYFALPTSKKSQKITCLLLFRVTSFIPFLIFASILIKSTFIVVILILLVLAGYWFLKVKLDARIALIPLFLTAGGHFFALLSWVLQGYLLFTLISGDNLELTAFAMIFLTGQVIAAISNLPFGLGVKEFYFTAHLHAWLDPTQLILFFLLLRLSGELLTGLTGWCFAAAETAKKTPTFTQGESFNC